MTGAQLSVRPKSWGERAARDFARNKYVYAMAIPMLIYYYLFCYYPMYGAVIAFKDYSAGLGIMGSRWVGLKHFRSFFGSVYFMRLIRNTVSINLLNLIFAFPAPILLALSLNELRQPLYKRVVQTISYLPHFISIMVICGLIRDFTSSRGVINIIVEMLGGTRQTMLLNPALFKPIYIVSDIWQGIGWGSIVYLAALTGIDPELYEAARIDGAGRIHQTLHITLPGISPTIVTLLILRVGQIMNVGYEKIILLYNETIYETADVISSFVYRKGVVEASFSYSSAVGLFNSAVNMLLVLLTNQISRKLSETSLW